MYTAQTCSLGSAQKKVPPAKTARLAEAFPKDPATGVDNKLIDVSQQPAYDSGGAGAGSTAGDYLRYCQAMLNGASSTAYAFCRARRCN